MKNIAILVGALVALVAPAGASPMSGMSTMQYYVGSWNCSAGNVGQPMSKATATFTLDNGLLREWVVVPAQGKMKNTYVLSIATTYDAKANRFIETQTDNMGNWTASYAKPWMGTTEDWTDHASADGKLGHSQTMRTSASSFSFVAYPTISSMKAVFKGSCTKA